MSARGLGACWSDEGRRQASVVRSQGSVAVKDDQASVVGNGVGRMENLDFPGQLRAAEEGRRLLKLAYHAHYEQLVAAAVDRLDEFATDGERGSGRRGADGVCAR